MSHRGKRQPTADGSLGAPQGPVSERPEGQFGGECETAREAHCGPEPTARFGRPREWLFAAALVAAVFLAYQPAWQGGFLWDDDTHLLKNPVLNPGGVFRTWVPGSYSNYWPVTSTVYWLQYQLWGLEPVGYHLVNIALHALSAILIWRILDRLRVPGALLAGALFALHPVNVQSVAWITQLKNTLSLALSLLSVLLYLWSEQRGGAEKVGADYLWSEQRGGRWLFVAAVAAFAMATLSKGMTLTLPVVLLACAWWQRGRIQRRDLLRVVPYLLIASLMVGMEVYHQHLAVTDQSVVRSDGLLSRTAVAGCAVWFYLWKLIWPVHLAFIYRRWDLAAVNGLWFAPGLLLAAIFALAWRWRRSWGRPVLMAAVCYVALLLPALGLVNVAFMEFSLVADHWQYAAMIVPCAALAGAVGAASSRRPWGRLPGAGLCLAALATLAVLTWRQSRTYADVETLYRTTIARNPDCWMAHNNLGIALAARRRSNEAIEQYREALRIWPGYAQAHFNLAGELAQCGRVDEAVEHYQRALELDPKYPAAHVGLGLALARRGQLDEATAHFRKALAINPDVADAHSNLGLALERYGRTEEAIGHYRRALEIDPRHLPARINLGLALARSGRMDEAIEHYQRALRMKPGDAKVHYALGLALVSSGRPDAAVAQFQRALKIDPGNAKVHYGLGFALAACQRLDEAIEHYQRAVELEPRYAEAHNDLGTALARCGRTDEAVAHFRRALEISPQSVEAHNNLGLALAGCGRTAEAIEHYRKALALAQQQNKSDMAADLEAKLRLYQAETPAREPPRPSQ